MFRLRRTSDTDDEYSKKLICEFEGEDILDKKVYDLKGKLITEQPNMTCNKCGDYVFREDSDECYDYYYNKEYNEGWLFRSNSRSLYSQAYSERLSFFKTPRRR